MVCRTEGPTPWRGADLPPEQRHYSALGMLNVALDGSATLSFDLHASRREVNVEDPGASDRTHGARNKSVVSRRSHRPALQENLRLAEGHVADGAQHVRRRREHIEGLERGGQDATFARELLRTL